MNLTEMAMLSKKATHQMARASTHQKNEALYALIDYLKKEKEILLHINQKDINQAKESGLSKAMFDRLSLQERIEGIISDIQQVCQLPDPIGECLEKQTLGELQIEKRRTPIGVLGVIYESRPNVTIDITTLSIKSGNCALLRGGSETFETNQRLVKIIQESLTSVGLPSHAIQLVPSRDREQVRTLLRLHDYIDLIIPRGGAALHRYCRENSTIPVITGGIGICHLFVDSSAELDKSLKVIINAKTQRPTVCNALDTLLVHEEIAYPFIPLVVAALSEKDVEFRLDPKSLEIVQQTHCQMGYALAGVQDWDTEWLSLVLGIKVVKNLHEAIEHITTHSTGHSDGILTQNKPNADHFINEIDSAAVYVNASTRFTDGSQLGLGAEVAISTQKLHARGPMGLKELTSYKWVIHGDYSIRR